MSKKVYEYDTMYDTIIGKLRTHLSISANKLVVACFVSHGGICMSSSPSSQKAASAESMQLQPPPPPGLASSAPLLVSTDPGISTVGTAHCAVIPKGLKIGKVNFGAIGAIAGVSEILNNSIKAELLPGGSQPNNILYILRECVQMPLHTDSHSNLHQLCAIMQDNIRHNFTQELTANVGQFIADSRMALQSIQSEIDQITQSMSKSDKPIDKKRNAAKLERAMKRLDDAVIDLHSQEQLARNLAASTLFTSHVEPRCLFNKMYVRNTEREHYPGPDWHIQLFARDGSLLVANMAELKKGKPQNSRSKPWAIVETMDRISPGVIAQEYGMDLLTLVGMWKQRHAAPEVGGVVRVTTQDILAFLKECGAEEVILVDCTCSVFIDPVTGTIVYCDPSQVNGKGCSACGTMYDKHSFGGGRGGRGGKGGKGRGMRRAYIKTARRHRIKSKSKSRSIRRRVRI